MRDPQASDHHSHPEEEAAFMPFSPHLAPSGMMTSALSRAWPLVPPVPAPGYRVPGGFIPPGHRAPSKTTKRASATASTKRTAPGERHAATGRRMIRCCLGSRPCEICEILWDRSDGTTTCLRLTSSPACLPAVAGEGRVGRPVVLEFFYHHPASTASPL